MRRKTAVITMQPLRAVASIERVESASRPVDAWILVSEMIGSAFAGIVDLLHRAVLYEHTPVAGNLSPRPCWPWPAAVGGINICCISERGMYEFNLPSPEPGRTYMHTTRDA